MLSSSKTSSIRDTVKMFILLSKGILEVCLLDVIGPISSYGFIILGLCLIGYVVYDVEEL